MENEYMNVHDNILPTLDFGTYNQRRPSLRAIYSTLSNICLPSISGEIANSYNETGKVNMVNF